jgi:hypothetical protein
MKTINASRTVLHRLRDKPALRPLRPPWVAWASYSGRLELYPRDPIDLGGPHLLDGPERLWWCVSGPFAPKPSAIAGRSESPQGPDGPGIPKAPRESLERRREAFPVSAGVGSGKPTKRTSDSRRSPWRPLGDGRHRSSVGSLDRPRPDGPAGPQPLQDQRGPTRGDGVRWPSVPRPAEVRRQCRGEIASWPRSCPPGSHAHSPGPQSGRNVRRWRHVYLPRSWLSAPWP